MPIADRFIHTLAIVIPTEDGEDDYGQPEAGEPLVEETVGLIQPKSAREVAAVSQAGAALSDHVIFLAPRDLPGAAYVRFEPDDGDRYQIVGVRRFAFGRNPHLEVDAKRVVSEPLEVAAS